MIANAGGVNPDRLCREVRRARPGAASSGRARATISPPAGRLLAGGQQLQNIDTGEPLARIREHIQSANVYIGAFPLAEALATGADVVDHGTLRRRGVGSGANDSRIWLEAGGDWDLLAAACRRPRDRMRNAGTGGNCTVDWQTTPDFAQSAIQSSKPKAMAAMVITKHAGHRRPGNARNSKRAACL